MKMIDWKSTLFVTVVIVLISITACTPKLMQEVTFDERLLDTLTVSAPRNLESQVGELSTYHATASRTMDLIHTSLDLDFDWDQSAVLGKAMLEIKPYFSPINQITLDAKDFEIHSIVIDKSPTTDYNYDGKTLKVNLKKKYTKDEKIIVEVDYTAYPKGSPNSGAAITSDQGLFFINPKGEYPDKPTQIWTQGETEYNSRWFPTIDKPNERCTQEIKVTVPDSLVTLSNGILVSSKSIGNGLRQDHWEQKLPHAPYLFMLAIGDYAVVEEMHGDIPLQYMVYPEYRKDAKKIFNHTPEMLTFFSKIVGYNYPWDKYSQVIAEDYVSGAMENTTAVIFGEFVQKDSRALLDEPNDKIVAHEMFHHWFGDLVTCESWSNLTMNEGFANYGEYLWLEHKYGRDKAEEHRIDELQSYLATTQDGETHDLIHFGYESMEDMFDVHSYNKGGLVLHQLRYKLGDEVFFAGLSHYLHQHEYSSVEAHDLRLAMEHVSGRDLNTFWNQWYFSSGHPDLKFDYEYKTDSIIITATQLQQSPNHYPIFTLQLTPRVYFEDGSDREISWTIDSKTERLSIPVEKTVNVVVADGNHTVLGNITEPEYTNEQLNHLALYSDEYQDLITVIEALPEYSEEAKVRLRSHPYETIRSRMIELNSERYSINQLMDYLKTDPSPLVRKAAIFSIAMTGNRELAKQAAVVGLKDQSYSVEKEAIYITLALDSLAGRKLVDSISVINPLPYLDVISDLTAQELEESDLEFYHKYLNQCVDQSIYYVVNDYIKLVKTLSMEQVKSSIQFMQNLKDGTNEYYKSYFYGQAIDELKEHQEDQ